MGEFKLKEGTNSITISNLKSESKIHAIYVGDQPPFVPQPQMTIPTYEFSKEKNTNHSKINILQGLGYSNCVTILPFTSPAYSENDNLKAPWVEYPIDLLTGENSIEIRTLPTQQIHSGGGVRYTVSINNDKPRFFSIQANEFSTEWQENVLQGG